MNKIDQIKESSYFYLKSKTLSLKNTTKWWSVFLIILVLFNLKHRLTKVVELLDAAQLLTDLVNIVHAVVDRIGNPVNKVVVSLVQLLVKFLNLLDDVFDPFCKMLYLFIKLALSFLGSDAQVNVCLHVARSITVVHLDLLLSLIWHCWVLVQGSVFLAAGYLETQLIAFLASLETVIRLLDLVLVLPTCCLQHHVVDILD